ncbi:MAG: transketolase [Candidatus Eremiobacteraeota bacterium]|nr:transketolase [Candidatus Eremiobacteraeota bacterium]
MLTTPPPRIRLDERSRALRELIVDALVGGKRGHVGSALSLVEILRVLYDDVLRVRPKEPKWPHRDRAILSKGHGCLALYAILADRGFFSREELVRQGRAGALLGGHPEIHIPGVEASTGALGHGLPIGVGLALAARMQRRSHRVFVVTGDGELDEGSNWEAALAASKHRLENLVAIVDYNKLQSYGSVDDVLPLEPLAEKWRAFGFAVRECDGHDVGALRANLCDVPFERGKPSVLLAHTVKGAGIPICEHDPVWHHKASFDAAAGETLRRSLAEDSG